MAIQFQRAQRKKAKLRLALAGPAGSGKTYSALLIAFGLGGRIAMIDTERSSGELYSHLGEYDVCTLEPPFTPEKYTEAIRAAEEAGYDVIIIDSLSHAWAGPGGVLDIHGFAADRGGNSWTAWRQVTPRHNDLVNTMLQTRCHVIATMRSKMDHVQTTENGKAVIKKVGMNPIQRDGMEYEFTVFMDLDISHLASAGKDRTGLFDGQVFKPSAQTGQRLLQWLESGAEPAPGQGNLFVVGGSSAPTREENPFPPAEEHTSPDPRAQHEVQVNPMAATQAQIRKIHATQYELKMSDEELLNIYRQETGKKSEQDLTKREASLVIDCLTLLLPSTKQAAAGSGSRKRFF